MPFANPEDRRKYQRERRRRLKAAAAPKDEGPRIYISIGPQSPYGPGVPDTYAKSAASRSYPPGLSHPQVRFMPIAPDAIAGFLVTDNPEHWALVEQGSEYGKTVFRIVTA